MTNQMFATCCSSLHIGTMDKMCFHKDEAQIYMYHCICGTASSKCCRCSSETFCIKKQHPSFVFNMYALSSSQSSALLDLCNCLNELLLNYLCADWDVALWKDVEIKGVVTSKRWRWYWNWNFLIFIIVFTVQAFRTVALFLYKYFKYPWWTWFIGNDNVHISIAKCWGALAICMDRTINEFVVKVHGLDKLNSLSWIDDSKWSQQLLLLSSSEWVADRAV